MIKFIVDAQLPYRLATLLRDKGFDTIHTDDLPNKERTNDAEIRSIAKTENRIVITKDNDFFDSYIIKKILHAFFLFLLATLPITHFSACSINILIQ